MKLLLKKSFSSFSAPPYFDLSSFSSVSQDWETHLFALLYNALVFHTDRDTHTHLFHISKKCSQTVQTFQQHHTVWICLSAVMHPSACRPLQPFIFCPHSELNICLFIHLSALLNLHPSMLFIIFSIHQSPTCSYFYPPFKSLPACAFLFAHTVLNCFHTDTHIVYTCVIVQNLQNAQTYVQTF